MNTSHVLVQAFNKINESSLTQSVAQTLEILYSEHLKGQAWTEASKTQEPRSTDFQQSVEMGGGGLNEIKMLQGHHHLRTFSMSMSKGKAK